MEVSECIYVDKRLVENISTCVCKGWGCGLVECLPSKRQVPELYFQLCKNSNNKNA